MTIESSEATPNPRGLLDQYNSARTQARLLLERAEPELLREQGVADMIGAHIATASTLSQYRGAIISAVPQTDRHRAGIRVHDLIEVSPSQFVEQFLTLERGRDQTQWGSLSLFQLNLREAGLELESEGPFFACTMTYEREIGAALADPARFVARLSEGERPETFLGVLSPQRPQHTP